MTEPASPAAHPYSSARHPQPRHVSPAESLVWLKAGWSYFMQSGVWIAISVIFIVMLFVLGLVPCWLGGGADRLPGDGGRHGAGLPRPGPGRAAAVDHLFAGSRCMPATWRWWACSTCSAG
jgi:hypothetical protein